MKLAKFTKSCDANDMPAGVKARLYLACTCDVQQDRLRTYSELRALSVLPSGITLPTTENKLSERVTIGEAVVFPLAGTGFTAYDIVITSGSYSSKTKGEAQFTAFENEVTFMMKGSNAEVVGFADLINNRGLLCVIGDMGGADDYKLFGQKEHPAFITSIDIESGAKAGDKRVSTFKIADMSGRSLRDYPLSKLHPSGLPIAV
jgi:hypothetical protein